MLPSTFRRASRIGPQSWDLMRVFDELLPTTSEWFGGGGEGMGMLPLDVEETDDKYNVTLDVPGVSKNNIEIEMEGRDLTVSVRQKEEVEKTERNFTRRERRFGSTSRTVHLPLAARDESVEASLCDGVLRIAINKAPESKTKKIEIH